MGNHDTAPHKSVYENQSTGLFNEMEKKKKDASCAKEMQMMWIQKEE